MFGATKPLPPYLQGLGQDTGTESWVTSILKPVADVIKRYYEIQAQQYGPQAQQVAQTTQFPSLMGISPIYLIGGGLLLWYLLKGGKEIRGKSRRNPCRRRNPRRRRRR